MLRRVLTALLAPLFAVTLLSGCDGEKIDETGARYDIVWSWRGGDNLLGVPGVYGSLGVAAATSKPGARHGAMRWQDADGNFWLFGGRGFSSEVEIGRLHDLWKFSPASGQWTWVGGWSVSGGTITHSGAGIYSAADPADNLPGARNDGVTWVDAAGDFWLFGGEGYDSAGTFGRLNDLWKYNVATATWTWMGGSNLVGQLGQANVYGTPGTAAAGNWPGARYQSTGWVDAGGAFWLFGGSGLDVNGACCLLNDLWKYSGGQWAWMTGSSTKDALPVYGAQGVAAAANTPSGRTGAVTWLDATGNAWLFGGAGTDATGANFVSAELWKYTAAGWMWVSGTQGAYVTPVQNDRGVAALTSTPGSRTRATAWKDAAGAFWLYGGDVSSSAGGVTNPNDLWRYQQDPNADGNTVDASWSWMGGSRSDNPAGRYISVGGNGQPGGRGGAAGWISADGKLWLFGGDLDNTERNDLWYYAP